MLHTSSQLLRTPGRGRQLLALLQKGFAINWLLMFAGTATIITLLVSLIGIIVDPRIITGMPAWVKPAKFSISITIYSFTLLWFLHFIQGHKRLVSIIANIVGAALLIEIVIIAGQVVRGTSSHFNNSTLFDRTLYIIMGSSITVVFVLGFVTAILLLLQRLPDPVLAWSLRLGLLISLVGMAVAFLMTQPTAIQMTTLQAGGKVTAIGAHSVGVVDGGPGLPFVGWSTSGGDLRIPHFIGLHALQVLPLIGWLLTRSRFSFLPRGHRVALVWTSGMSYLALTGLLIWQALRAQPLLAPDTLTLQVSAVLLTVTGLAIIGIVTHARSKTSTQAS
jgi:hypothetical protein